MGYFDNPQHKAEWEKELSELREVKARLHGKAVPSSHNDEREYEQPVNNRDFSDEFSAPEREEPTVFEREESTTFEREEPAAFEREEPAAFEREEPAAFEREEPAAFEREEPVAFEREERTVPERAERTAPVRARSGEMYRERITFNELLAMENMNAVQKTTEKPREMQRQKEVSHVL